MDITHYQPMTSKSISNGCVTNYGWGVSGTKTSADNYTTYEISIYKGWYVYRHKPSWFGQHEGDRYLGRLRWISRHADGKQWKQFYQHGICNGWKVAAGDEKANDRIARDLVLAYGYLTPYEHSELRNNPIYGRKITGYRLSIRCAHCGMTGAEHSRRRQAHKWGLMYPKGDVWPRMHEWAAHIIARESITCRCPYTPNQERIQHCIETGDGLDYN